MFNKICFLIISFTTILFIGCSSQVETSQISKSNQPNATASDTSVQQEDLTQNIRPQFLHDSRELYLTLDYNFKNALMFSDADSQKMKIYMEKYSHNNIKDFNEQEKQLENCILEMIQINISYTKSKLNNDKNLEQESMKQYVLVSDKAKQLLGIN